MYARLKPGAPLVVAHHSFVQTGGLQDRRLKRNAAYSAAVGIPLAQAEHNIQSIRELLPVLSPKDDVEILEQAGFINIELFYAGFTFKGTNQVGGIPCYERWPHDDLSNVHVII